DLLYKKRDPAIPDDQQLAMFDNTILSNTLERRGQRDPLFESHILHQFCSSPARVKVLCEKLEKRQFNVAFAGPERLRRFIQARIRLVERAAPPLHDVKLGQLIEIIAEHPPCEVTIFCHYSETAKRLKEGLQKRLRRLRLETAA